MKECCEPGGESPRKKRYWHWVALGCVVVIAVGLQLIPPRYCTRCSSSRIVVATIIQALNEYMINNQGKYPATLQPLVDPDQDGHCYLEGFNGKIPRDPWKREYIYAAPTAEHPKPRVLSFGADGKPGGTDDDEDVDSDALDSGGR